jgi:hypothetical protein
MADDIDVLKAKSAPKPSFSNLHRDNLATSRNAKRRTDDGGEQSGKRPHVATPSVIIDNGAAANDLKFVAPLKWLYVLRLHQQTSEKTIRNKFSGALLVHRYEFKCANQMSNPTFISFKVGMTEELFQRCLAPEIWLLVNQGV